MSVAEHQERGGVELGCQGDRTGQVDLHALCHLPELAGTGTSWCHRLVTLK